MADRNRRRRYSRTSSNSSTSVAVAPEEAMGKPRSDVSPGSGKEQPEKRKVRPKRERWLLTRKTWRYMADAGRRLIPEGLQNRPEDVPKIEAYFQEVCQKEPRFLLWRKQSYPGALGFRSRGRSRGGRKKMGGSCRDKTSSADEAEDIKKGFGSVTPQQSRKVGSRLDLKRLKEEFLLGFPNPYRSHPQTTLSSPEEDSDSLLETLEMYLKEKPSDPKAAGTSKSSLNHEELLLKLRDYLATIDRVAAEERARAMKPVSVHFEGDHMQKMLLETIRRHFGKSTSREKMISDLLTDRKSLEKLYFDLRKARNFKSGRRSGESGGSSFYGSTYTTSTLRPLWKPSSSRSSFGYQDLREEEGSGDEEESTDSKLILSEPTSPPPVIEVEAEEDLPEKCYATQTEPIPESTKIAIQQELKRIQLAKKEAEEQEAKEELSKPKGFQRRTSVDNDDVSPSVGDTIKRYLRMARKKSIDSDKADRFKRVNYDKNIRNIKPKGEITQIGDDDGLDKGVQTDESWVVALKELKLEDKLEAMSRKHSAEEHSSSRITSSRSSVDTGVDDLSSPPQSPISPTKSASGILSSGQSFMSKLLHHQKSRNAPPSVSAVPGVMQKSKSSSSVVQQGSRLVSKKIWKSRSKSQTRATPSATSAWTPQGNCQWSNVVGRTVTITDTTLLQLSDIERRVLQKVALAKLQALNLGVAVRIPSESATGAVQKPKRRAYLLKRKAITTSFFDSKPGKDDKGEGGGMVFGIPLGQCVEQERLARLGKSEDTELRRKAHHGSRTSCNSLIECARDEKGSSESLIGPGSLSIPGQLDTLSIGSALDLDPGGVPNIVATCLRHLESYGLHTLGIFRVSSSKKRVRQLREDFDCGKDISMEADLCPHDVATLLKEYFRDLPDCLLCKDLYTAFIQTQRIRNRRLQTEALQHLLQLLPVANRDTLWALLCLLNEVARNCEDHKDTSGEWVAGNKMDSNNLATLFAPNILHPSKTTSKDELSAERTEERSDAINVVRALIDNYRTLYQVSAELLDEVYVDMMDSHPEALNQIMQRRDLAAEETEDLDVSTQSEERLQSQESLLSTYAEEQSSSRKTWSREAFTHETAGMGGPDLEIKTRKERGRERGSKKRWRDEQTGNRRRLDSEHSTTSRRTSATSYHDEPLHLDDPLMFRRKTADSGVITASLKIPVPQSSGFTLNLDDSDIPFIEDSDRQQMAFGIVRTMQRMSSDSSQASTYVHHVTQGHDSAVGSSVSPPHNSVSSYSSGGAFSSPPSWASSPPLSPTSPPHTTGNYLPDEPTTARFTIPSKKTPDPQQRVTIQRVTIKSGQVQQVKQTHSVQESASAVVTHSQERRHSKDQRLAPPNTSELAKSASVSSVAVPVSDRPVTPSISNIGGAVMRSKTADIERMLKIQSASTKQSSSKKSTGSSEEETKIKRKYTDSRHQTRTLVTSSETSGEATMSSSTRSTEQRRSGVMWKRKELISSEPKERKGFFN